MKAAKRFVDNLKSKIDCVQNVKIYLYGSLALTGVGHGTPNAIIYGLLGFTADQIDLSQNYIERVKSEKVLLLGGQKNISFDCVSSFRNHDIR